MDWTSIPKVELHLHLDGSVRPETLWQLLQASRRESGNATGNESRSATGDVRHNATKHDSGAAGAGGGGADGGGSDVSAVADADVAAQVGAAGETEDLFADLNSFIDVKNWIEVGDDCGSLTEYLARFELPLAVMQTREALERIAYELVSDVAKENVRYAEVRYAPILHTRAGLTMGDSARAVLAGLQRGERAFGVRTGLIACCMRHVDPADNVEMVRQLAPLKGQGVVAIDLAGDEAAFPAERHLQAFTLAREIGFPITVHAGEAGGAGEMRYAIENLGAQRIGHGVRLDEDPDLMQRVIREGVTLDMCPISNTQTKAVSSLSEHPLRRYLEVGVRITISTDNRTISATTLAQEYERIAAELGVTPEQVRQMIIYAAEAAYLPEEERRQLVAELKSAM